MQHAISLHEAVAMTTRYRQHRDSILAAQHQGQNILPLSETFDRAALDALLAKPECTAIRIYYGMDEALKVHAILVANDADNADILPAALKNKEEEGDDIVDRGIRCPTLCPKASPLNE